MMQIFIMLKMKRTRCICFIVCRIISVLLLLTGLTMVLNTAAIAADNQDATLETWDPAAPASPAESPMTDIHDIQPPVSVPYYASALLWVLITLIVLVVIAALVWWIRRRRVGKNAKEAAAVRISPEKEALSALEQLPMKEGDPRTFYFALSEIARRYIERSYDIQALEMTTEELVPSIREIPVNPDQSRMLTSFFRETDPVRYGGMFVSENQLTSDLAAIRKFVIEDASRRFSENEDSRGEP